MRQRKTLQKTEARVASPGRQRGLVAILLPEDAASSEVVQRQNGIKSTVLCPSSEDVV